MYNSGPHENYVVSYLLTCIRKYVHFQHLKTPKAPQRNESVCLSGSEPKPITGFGRISWNFLPKTKNVSKNILQTRRDTTAVAGSNRKESLRAKASVCVQRPKTTSGNPVKLRLLSFSGPSTRRLARRVALVVGQQEAEAGERQAGQAVCVGGDLHVAK